MADSKISALTGASTPLVGTEVLPIVQSDVQNNVLFTNIATGKLSFKDSSGVINALY